MFTYCFNLLSIVRARSARENAARRGSHESLDSVQTEISDEVSAQSVLLFYYLFLKKNHLFAEIELVSLLSEHLQHGSMVGLFLWIVIAH